jgi:hypothetical protein
MHLLMLISEQVRKRIDVVGERGTILQGTWVMDDASGGGTFKGIYICIKCDVNKCVRIYVCACVRKT